MNKVRYVSARPQVSLARTGSFNRLCFAVAAAAVAAVPSCAWAQGADVEPASLQVPSLVFTESPADRQNYEKYFYFVREDTDFEAAYADIAECDGYARGLSFSYRGTGVGGVAGALGDGLSDALFGAAGRRDLRRINVRTCMAFKGYHRYGLPRDIWRQFNFEEGNKAPTETARQRYLMQQARIASSAMPATIELGQ